MKKVFFGGSRKIGRLNKALMERADNIISKGYLVLVGDANGADKAMQKYLAGKSYPHVMVFCAGTTCRNNLGEWHMRFVETGREEKDFQHYAVRDRQMSSEADYGFMLWDGKSKGTLNNIVNLYEQGKLVIVYLSSQRKFFTINSEAAIDELLSFCDKRDLEKLEKILKIRQRIHPAPSQLALT